MMEKVTTKRCTWCKEMKPMHEFHKDRSKPDGHVFRCKGCKSMKSAHRAYYLKNRERILQVSKLRSQTEEGRRTIRKSSRKYQKKNPEKKKAHSRFYERIRHGKLARERCLFCWTHLAEAHHEDYSKPLEVTWLCRRCHNFLHRQRKGDQ